MTGTVFRAAWVVPITGLPRRDAWIAVSNGLITAVGDGPIAPQLSTSREVDLGHVALLPGLINAHTHLELSWLRGRVPPAPSLPLWVRSLLRARAAGDDGGAVEGALDEAVGTGTAAIGDISNTLLSTGPLAARAIPAVVFHETLGFDPADASERAAATRTRLQALALPPSLRVRMAPHAPYSTSAALIRLLANESRFSTWPTTSIHVAESPEEVEFLEKGGGAWDALLRDLGVPHGAWHPPGRRPVDYLDTLGVWRPGALAVHCVQVTAAELDLLVARDVTVVTCPRSNVWVGVGAPPVKRFVASGVRVALGTDSLASVGDLNLFSELQSLRELAPDVPARTFLEWATINGARALGLDAEWGALQPGHRARFLAVDLLRPTFDVEETLLGGVEPHRISWIDDRSERERARGTADDRRSDGIRRADRCSAN
jgi:cytosine/adenosine deaminase-related metal-dependent hydrolase